MNKRNYLIQLMLICGICRAQNLVPNGDFEQYSTCPLSQGEILNAIPWINPAVMGFGGSPDYFNQCSPAVTNGQSVPQNISGIQQAQSDKRLVSAKA